MQDAELLKRIRQGEKELISRLAEKYYDEIFRFCYYKTGNEQTAYDCTQETFLHLIKFMNSYVEIKRFKSYLLRMALNVCRDYYRRTGTGTLSYEELAEESERGGQGLEGLHRECGQESSKVVDAMLVQQLLLLLPDFQREVIILHFYYGYKVREIAHITGAALPTVKSRLKQGMDKLKEYVKKEGLYEEE